MSRPCACFFKNRQKRSAPPGEKRDFPALDCPSRRREGKRGAGCPLTIFPGVLPSRDIGLPQLRLALDIPRIHVPTGQDLPQVLPLQMVHQMAVIGTGFLESVPLRRHEQNASPATPPEQVSPPSSKAKRRSMEVRVRCTSSFSAGGNLGGGEIHFRRAFESPEGSAGQRPAEPKKKDTT